MQQFIQSLRTNYPQSCPMIIAQAYLKETRSYVGMTNILSFNTRAIALMVSILIGKPWCYFIFEITFLNLLLAYMLRKYEVASTDMCKLLNSNFDQNGKAEQ